ncbi:hypothetical protein TRFO_36303 [Tritrichomonas foetus]|uniref:RING-type domain-containing protein n=1 Tax=Tritrichomonas foetus TaxID=1144522 RepID=A0A1J4JE99_9EUKA|nr:hypothetical protein TRFO_36303 [Tritrichomonas foetus]|eukprot:OHS97482.1 hypothetical protein TRFO_36303 [Tritrichomonas foetus]
MQGSENRFLENLPQIIDFLQEHIQHEEQLKKLRQDELLNLKAFHLNILNMISKLSIYTTPEDLWSKQVQYLTNNKIANENSISELHSFVEKHRQKIRLALQIKYSILLTQYAIKMSPQYENLPKLKKKIEKFLPEFNSGVNPSLNQLLDSKLRPYYSTYIHLFEQRFFPSNHPSINPFYISQLAPFLVCNKSVNGTVLALKIELEKDKKMVDEMFQILGKCYTEYDLYKLSKKFPSTQQIISHPIFIQKYQSTKENLNSLLRRINSFLSNVCATSDDLSLYSANVNNIFKKLNKMKDDFCVIVNKFYSLKYHISLADYFQRVFDYNESLKYTRTMTIAQPVQALFQQLSVWDKLQKCLIDTFDKNGEFSNYSSDKREKIEKNERNDTFDENENPEAKITLDDLYKCINDLKGYLNEIKYLNSVLIQTEKTKEKELEASRYERRQVNIDYRDLNDNNLMGAMYKSNVDRLNSFDSIFVKYEDLNQQLLNLINPELYLNGFFEKVKTAKHNVEYYQRLEEIKYLRGLIEEKREKIEKYRKMNEQMKEENKEGKRVDQDLVHGADDRYTKARIFLSCMNCDEQSEFVCKPCNHKICQKCYDKAKSKLKNVRCPFCLENLIKVVKINW